MASPVSSTGLPESPPNEPVQDEIEAEVNFINMPSGSMITHCPSPTDMRESKDMTVLPAGPEPDPISSEEGNCADDANDSDTGGKEKKSEGNGVTEEPKCTEDIEIGALIPVQNAVPMEVDAAELIKEKLIMMKTQSQSPTYSSSGSSSPSGPRSSMGKRISATNYEEEVFKRRLHIELNGDEGKILKLTKAVANFSIDKIDPMPAEKTDLMYQNMKALLRSIEYGAKKDCQAIKNIEQTKDLCHDVGKEIQSEIEKTRGLISSMKQKTAAVKREQTIDVVLKVAKDVVAKLPTTEAGQKQIVERESTLRELRKKRRTLKQNLVVQEKVVEEVGKGIKSLAEVVGGSKEIPEK